MKVLNEPKVFHYIYTCRCEAMLQVSATDVKCYKVEGGDIDYVFIVECPICGYSHAIPNGKVPKKMRRRLQIFHVGYESIEQV